MPTKIDYDHLTTAFGQLLEDTRAQRGVRADEFARSFGMDPSTYRGLESAVYGPSLYYFLKIADGLPRPTEDLIADIRKRMDVLAEQAPTSSTQRRD